jgi:2-polyprenyl-3-methyl-5-hydroxy-6-metoxy-1,4-benzoquinol methylase
MAKSPPAGLTYGAAAFWDQRYEHETATFDWLQTWDSIKPLLLPHLRPGVRILVLGCGNSPMSEQMHTEGFTNITNVDISPHVIRLMKGRAEAKDMSCMRRNRKRPTTGGHGVGALQIK